MMKQLIGENIFQQNLNEKMVVKVKIKKSIILLIYSLKKSIFHLALWSKIKLLLIKESSSFEMQDWISSQFMNRI